MKTRIPEFTRRFALGTSVIGIVAFTCLFEVHDADAAGPRPTVNRADRAEWIRLLINRSRGDVEADAAGAVDGVKDGGFGFHTDRQKEPWWQVDLQQVHSLHRALVFNRSTAQERARHLVLQISVDGKAWQSVYKHDGSLFEGPRNKKPLQISLGGRQGRFVRIRIDDTNWLHLSEVEVYGILDKDKNLALGKPALQSSISHWSKKAKVNS